MSDAFARELCPARPEDQLASSSCMECGVRSGAQEQDEIHEYSVPEPATELAENEREEEEQARRSNRC